MSPNVDPEAESYPSHQGKGLTSIWIGRKMGPGGHVKLLQLYPSITNEEGIICPQKWRVKMKSIIICICFCPHIRTSTHKALGLY